MTGESQGQAGFDAGVAQGFLEKSSLFDGIPAGMVAAVAAVLKPVTLQAGDTLFSQGDAADGLYFLYDGTLEIEATIAEETKIIAGLAPNAVLGNVTKIGHTERFATARATRETLVLSLDEADFATVAENYVNEAETVAIRVGDLWQRLLFARFLRFSPPFNGLPEEALLALEQETEVLSVDRGTIMVSRGDPAEALYIVVNGRLRLWLPKGVTQNVLLRELGPRSILGDVEMLAQRSFMADVRAVRDSVVAKISRPRLELLLERFPLVMNGLLSRSLIRHIDAASEGRKARNTTTTLALVPTTAGVPIVEVGTQLADAISHFGRTLLLNSAICDEWFGVVGAAQTPMGSSRTRMLQSWLNQQEFAHDFTIYTADPDVTNWTRRCVRQADHVLFIAPTDAPPDMGDIEEQVLDEENLVGVRKSLVLLHPEETTIPSRTNDWLVRRRLTMHHHLRRHNGDDMGRLARFLVGRAVALVLGGGGARGFAHVGVLRAMEEAGIPIDLVGGASMGALVGAQLAMQLSGDQIIDNTMGLVKAGDRLTVPAVSLFSAEKFSAGMDKMFGGGMIEDLWRRYFSVSCNLTRARVEVHDKGPLTDAVLASNTPPGLFPPYIQNNDLLVDGGLLNNLPVDIMQRYNEGGIIIAVDVNPREDLHSSAEVTRGLSGFTILKNKLNPFTEAMDIPGFFDIILRATQIGGVAQYRRVKELADLYLSPPVSDYAISAHKQGAAIAERGYAYAQEPVTDWWREVDLYQKPKP